MTPTTKIDLRSVDPRQHPSRHAAGRSGCRRSLRGWPPPRRTRRWPCSQPLQSSVTRTGRHSSSPEKIIGTVASTRPSATSLPSTNRVAVPPLPSPCRRPTTRSAWNPPATAAFLSNEVAAVRARAGWSRRGGRSVHPGCPRFGPAPLQKRSSTTKSGRISSQSSTARCNVGLSARRDPDGTRRHRPLVVMPSADAADSWR